MAVIFPYEKSQSPILGIIYRPVAQAFFFSKKEQGWLEVWMLVDSGADYTLLPKYLASKIGVDLKKDCKVFRSIGIGGTEKVYFLKSIKVRLGNWERNIPVGFLDRNDVPPLLGRHHFLETFDVTLSAKHTITFVSK